MLRKFAATARKRIRIDAGGYRRDRSLKERPPTFPKGAGGFSLAYFLGLGFGSGTNNLLIGSAETATGRAIPDPKS